jgi:tRNA (guanine37-N1)-methyltransferase
VEITILTLFPDIFQPLIHSSIIGRAIKKNLVKINTVNIREFSSDKHRSVDDRPFGGGTGMILRVDIVEKALFSAKKKTVKNNINEKVILLEPSGVLYKQAKAREYAKYDHLIIICGHYEGIDSRIEKFCDEKLSIGEYVLTGGEIPAMVITDSVVRLIPEVLPKDATIFESFTEKNLLEAPHYTRPEEYKGLKVPKVLLSGNHKLIETWKKKNERYK